MTSVEQTLGQKRVRAAFNPSNDSIVDLIKEKAADLIDLCDSHMAGSTSGEERRLWALAMTHIEDAAMWAVKAATIAK